jgi:hypothetical protein
MLGSIRAVTALAQAGIPIGAVPVEWSSSGWSGAASSSVAMRQAEAGAEGGAAAP